MQLNFVGISELVSVQINPGITLKLIFKGYQYHLLRRSQPLMAWNCHGSRQRYGLLVLVYILLRSLKVNWRRAPLLSPQKTAWCSWFMPQTLLTWLRCSCHGAHYQVSLSWFMFCCRGDVWSGPGSLLTLALLCGLIAAHGSSAEAPAGCWPLMAAGAGADSSVLCQGVTHCHEDTHSGMIPPHNIMIHDIEDTVMRTLSWGHLLQHDSS